MKLLENLTTIILIVIVLTGCTQDLESFNNERLNYNFEYLNLTPNQTLKTETGDYKVIKPIRIWSDKSYLLLHQELMEKY